MRRKKHFNIILTIFVVSIVAVAPFLIMEVLLNPATKGFSEISVLGVSGSAEDYPTGFSNSSDYVVRLLVRNYEGQAEFYQIDIRFTFQNGRILSFMPTIIFEDGTAVGRILDNEDSWDTLLRVKNGSEILEQQQLEGEQPLKVQFSLLIFRNGSFEATGNSVYLWAYYPSQTREII